ncbi:hypothetical protein ISCU110981_19855 [Isoptericola cucumis]
MPRPWSRTVTTTPRSSRVVVTSTGVCGSENIVAFSSSSARRCAALSALCPSMCGSTVRFSRTRSYSSISDDAVRTTSDTGIGLRTRRPESIPARTRSDSALRRIRVARWSSRKRFDSVEGSSSDRSSSSRNASWRLRSTWSRRATLTNISAMEPRRAACSRATTIVVSFTSLNEAARRPISSLDSTGTWTRSTAGAWPGTAICSTICGRRSRTSAVATVRRRSGSTMRRAMTSASRNEMSTTPNAAAPVRSAVRCSSLALSAEYSTVMSRTSSRTGCVSSTQPCERSFH